MTRVLTFEFEKEAYVIKENSILVFKIDAEKLIFNSLEFYNGIYKDNKSTRIEFKNNIQEDLHKKGEYIYNWLSEIFSQVATVFSQKESIDNYEKNIEIAMNPLSKRTIPLYELAACGGDGFFIGNEDIPYKDMEVEEREVDYAITISGSSMEPTISDSSIVLVKAVQELSNGDIGIFLIDGKSICKRYNKKDNGTVVLTPDNNSTEYTPIHINTHMTCIIQGKVLSVLEPSTL